MKKNIQILLETVVRCGGNCSGCALSSVERMSKSNIDWKLFEEKAVELFQYLNQQNADNVESVSLFLGQGDHFLLSEDEMINFVDVCSKIVPNKLKHKTTTLITASAIGKEDVIKEKMDLFYSLFLSKGMPFFIQVVFDPKKMLVTEKFSNIYINNILYFKNKCGMTELTINVGEDLFETMTPLEFHNWTLRYGFKHVEMNWVMNKNTKFMWFKNNNYKKMFNWLKDLLILNAKEHLYEINFVPFLSRALNILKDEDLLSNNLIENISSQLEENIYIDNSGGISFCQPGLISNIVPIKERLTSSKINISNENELEKEAKNKANIILSKMLRKKACSGCEFIGACLQIGSYSWIENKNEDSFDCPWDIKDFLMFFKGYIADNQQYSKTKFDKNPIQNKVLMNENNADFEYFERRFDK